MASSSSSHSQAASLFTGYSMYDLYSFIPSLLRTMIPGIEIDDNVTRSPKVLLAYLDRLPRDTMNRHYESWAKKERKGKKLKIRWLSKVVTSEVFYNMDNIAKIFPLPASDYVYSYKKGVSTADCARQFTGMRSIVALDIKDFYYSITGKMVYELYRKHFESTVDIDSPVKILKMLCVCRMLSILFMSEDVRPSNLSYKEDTVLLQGTPHAGMLANAVLFDLDENLAELCSKHNLVYARYSDNFYIGSKEEIIEKPFIESVVRLIESFTIGSVKNFYIKKEKAKLMPYYTHQRVLGIVVNQHMNISSFTEDLINARIARYSKRVSDVYSVKSREVSQREYVPPTRAVVRAMQKSMRADLRELKGMISYLGSFNRSKYHKYTAYLEFIEQRATVMSRPNYWLNGVYGYTRSDMERRIIYGSLDTQGVPLISTGYKQSMKFLVLNGNETGMVSKFASCFEKGFLGIEYEDQITNNRVIVVPLDVSTEYLLLADYDMIESIRSMMSIVESPLCDFLAFYLSPYKKCIPAVQKITNMDSSFNGTYNEARKDRAYPVYLKSIMIYNRENPDGFVDFENYEMELRRYSLSEANVCIVKNYLDTPDIMYSNLWILRKDILNNRAALMNL